MCEIISFGSFEAVDQLVKSSISAGDLNLIFWLLLSAKVCNEDRDKSNKSELAIVDLGDSGVGIIDVIAFVTGHENDQKNILKEQECASYNDKATDCYCSDNLDGLGALTVRGVLAIDKNSDTDENNQSSSEGNLEGYFITVLEVLGFKRSFKFKLGCTSLTDLKLEGVSVWRECHAIGAVGDIVVHVEREPHDVEGSIERSDKSLAKRFILCSRYVPNVVLRAHLEVVSTEGEEKGGPIVCAAREQVAISDLIF